MTLLSVIIPAYNAEKTINRCVKSVLNQKSKIDFEIIIVDDGSKDMTHQIIEELLIDNHNIKYIYQENQGVSSARNNGIANSKGDYIAFLDSDDEFKEDLFNDFYETYINKDFDMYMFGYDIINEGQIESRKGINEYTNSPSRALEICLTNSGHELLACNKFWKKRLFEELKFPKEKLFEDMVISVETILISNSIIFRDISGYNYYRTENSRTTKDFNDNYYDLITENIRLIEMLKQDYKPLLKYMSPRFKKALASVALKTMQTKNEEIIKKYRKKLLYTEKEYNYVLKNGRISFGKFDIYWIGYKYFPKLMHMFF